ncbi:NADH-quinone oxidoreductase subunit I [bacterium]|nr:NADH-quinone oxidoreductase subunit I [bacterium]
MTEAEHGAGLPAPEPQAHAPEHEAPLEPPPEPGKSLADRLYVPAIVQGLGKTLKHFLQPKATVEYPERSIYQKEEADRAIGHENARYRGEHILVKDAQGREKCVACLLCMSACPALCIYIEPEPAPAEWKDRERRPKVFELDMLRCIYCGYCEEACPCDAIRLTPKFYQPSSSRTERVYDKTRLLENNPEWQRPQRPKK